jgi:hypothetical protein
VVVGTGVSGLFFCCCAACVNTSLALPPPPLRAFIACPCAIPRLQEMHAHRNILAARSPYFKGLLGDGMREAAEGRSEVRGQAGKGRGKQALYGLLAALDSCAICCVAPCIVWR